MTNPAWFYCQCMTGICPSWLCGLAKPSGRRDRTKNCCRFETCSTIFVLLPCIHGWILQGLSWVVITNWHGNLLFLRIRNGFPSYHKWHGFFLSEHTLIFSHRDRMFVFAKRLPQQTQNLFLFGCTGSKPVEGQIFSIRTPTQPEKLGRNL
jgi:hypothetical protein